MSKHTAKITSKSIAQSGLPSDFRKAIAEYIWNGFDAKANHIHVNFRGNEIGYIHSFEITDNGEGISIETIDQTFGHFLDSTKIGSFDGDNYVRGKKGKGRYSFSTFCNQAVWNTTCQTEKRDYLNYKIVINKSSQVNFNIVDQVPAKVKKTGTTVHFTDFFELSTEHLASKDFESYLSAEFGWFLFLNRTNDFQIFINGLKLNYLEIIEDNDEIPIKIGDLEFKITFIRWNQKIGDKYYYYFLNDQRKENSRKHTSWNNKAIDFHHSVYIESPYFNNFKLTKNDASTLNFAGPNQTDIVFKQLSTALKRIVSEKEKKFIRESQADKLIIKYRANDVLPKFRNNAYERIREQDLEKVIRELYCAEPQIFKGLKNTQSKTLVGFLNLLLDTDQRENVLDIVDDIINLTEEERNDLAKSLKKTRLASISAIIKLLENRFNVIEILKTLVFELEKFTNERDHIQRVVENNYWLFGEQYHLVSADERFEVVLNNYLYFLEKGQKKVTIDSKKKLIRPDIFICRKVHQLDSRSNEYTMEENIIVELKRPAVVIGKEQYSQIEDYLRFIIELPKFNSQLRRWKFILVGKKVDGFIEDKYESQKNKGQRFLVESVRNYQIYAMTWDDLFKIFEGRHRVFIDHLEFKSDVIEGLEGKGFKFSRALSTELTQKAVANS